MSLINRNIKYPVAPAFSSCHKLSGRRLRHIYIRLHARDIIFCTRARVRSESAENVSIFVLRVFGQAARPALSPGTENVASPIKIQSLTIHVHTYSHRETVNATNAARDGKGTIPRFAELMLSESLKMSSRYRTERGGLNLKSKFFLFFRKIAITTQKRVARNNIFHVLSLPCNYYLEIRENIVPP